jgi:aminomethyltransferase
LEASPNLKKTPLHEIHRQCGARLVEFAGWDMPVQYAGVIEEHLAVRKHAGLFDVSHMGEIIIRGPGALAAVQRLTSNDASRLKDGLAQYSALTTELGTPVDDILVHRIAADQFLLCVNAANDDKDFAWISEHLTQGAEVDHASDRYAQLALQGPAAQTILATLTSAALSGMPAFSFTHDRVAGKTALIARTGYTGEDGFEIYCAPADAPAIWEALMDRGRPHGLEPVGLGARDTLRLEACLSLYGNDIDDTTTLLEAGLNFIVKLDKGDFIGRDALVRQKQEGLKRRLVGFHMVDRGVARHGYPVLCGGREAGQVTSGTYAPYLRKNLGLAYLPIEHAAQGREFDVVIRAKPVHAIVAPTPFYKRPRPI